MKKILIILFALSIHSFSNIRSQTTDMNSVWAEKPGISTISAENMKENVVGVFMDERYEYFYDPEGNLLSNHVIHRRFRLNNDEAINKFNKLSVSLAGVMEVVDIRARVIKPDGNIIEFNKSNIKEIRDEESRDNYKIFAIDGIEKGDDIEYLIIQKMTASNFGRVYFQFDYPLQKADLEIVSPKNLVYATKGYNGLAEAKSEVMEDGRNRLTCSTENMPALKSMEYSYFNPGRARLEYKLEYNLSRGKSKLLTWNDASQRLYEIMYQDVNQKSVDKWMNILRIKDGSPLEKASKLEEYIKTNIHIEDFAAAEFLDLDFIRTNKVTGEQGIVRLYVNLLKALGVKHEIVLTSERDQIKFDPEFHSWNYLSKYLIYLPDDDTYIDPATNTFRIGCVSGELTATYGLFISIVKLGEFESAVGKIKYIRPTPFDANYDNMHIAITVDVDRQETRIRDTRGFKGLSGGFIGKIYAGLDEERKQEILKSLMESKATNPVYSELKVIEETEIDFIKNADFLVYSDFTTTSLLEIAGDKLLLNIGESIGPQVEMYNEDNKIRPAESEFNRWYRRKIVFTVPDGYRIANPEAADMNITGKSGEVTQFGFESTHELIGNQYIVDISEYYKEVYVTMGQFEGFRNVINAAANFNKVVIVLEKL